MSAVSSAANVPTPMRSLSGLLAASRQMHDSGKQCQASAAGATQSKPLAVVHTTQPARFTSVNALFASLQRRRECAEAAATAATPTPSQPSVCPLKRSAAAVLPPPQRARFGKHRRIKDSSQSYRVTEVETQAAEEVEAKSCSPLRTPAPAANPRVVPVRAASRRAAAAGARGSPKKEKRLRNELQVRSFGPGCDFLKDMASQSTSAAATVEQTQPASASASALPRSPRASKALDMSPSCLAFLDSLHTGLTPRRSESSPVRAPKSKASARQPFADSTSRAGGSRRARVGNSKVEVARDVPLGLDAFVCGVKAQRSSLPSHIAPAPSAPLRRSRGSGLAAVGELRQALRTIDAAAPPPGLRAMQVAESDEEAEGSEPDDDGPIARVPRLDGASLDDLNVD